MNSTPPFVAQEQRNTCALACLRMILAHHGTHVTESDLLPLVSLVQGGLDPDQIATVARHYGLHAEIAELDVSTIRDLVAQGRFPIVMIDRRPLDNEFTIHAVIAIRFTRHFVTVLDPLCGERRLSLRKFTEAQRRVLWAVICEPR